eukprot:1139492-Pelagomonas_calceolata.AAC.7
MAYWSLAIASKAPGHRVLDDWSQAGHREVQHWVTGGSATFGHSAWQVLPVEAHRIEGVDVRAPLAPSIPHPLMPRLQCVAAGLACAPPLHSVPCPLIKQGHLEAIIVIVSSSSSLSSSSLSYILQIAARVVAAGLACAPPQLNCCTCIPLLLHPWRANILDCKKNTPGAGLVSKWTGFWLLDDQSCLQRFRGSSAVGTMS